MKASVLFGAGWENDSVEVLWRDAGRAFFRLWQNDAKDEKHAFILIPAAAGHPTLECVDRLAHEHALKSYLDSIWALQPLELVRERGQTGDSGLHDLAGQWIDLKPTSGHRVCDSALRPRIG